MKLQWITLTFLGITTPLLAADLPVRARLLPNPVGLEEVATLEISFEASGFRAPTLDADFELENLEVLFGPARAQSFQWINGETSLSVTLTWRLRPLEEGKARVRNLQVTTGKEVLALPDLEVEVIRGSSSPPVANPPQRRAFPDPWADPFQGLFQPWEPALSRRTVPKVRVIAEVEPSSGWVGEQRIWRLVLLTQGDVSSFQPQAMPDFRGFWARDLKLPERVPLSWVELDGERYARQTMLAKALYPLQPGTLEIETVPVEVVVRVTHQGFRGFFAEPELRRLQTEKVRVEAKPLPAPVPGFQGLVGDLQVRSYADRTELRKGEALTWTVELSSTGQLSALTAPDLPSPPGLRFFRPKSELSEKVTSEGRLLQKLVWSFVVVPEEAGNLELPAFEIPFFDPRLGRFQVRRVEPILLRVLPDGAPEAPRSLGGEPARKEAGGASLRSNDSRKWVLVAGSVGFALVLGLLLLLRRRTPRDLSPARRQLVAELAKAEAEPPRSAAERLERAWQAFLWADWGMPLEQPLRTSGEVLQRDSRTRELGRGLLKVEEEIRALLEAPALADLTGQKRELLERSHQVLRSTR
jgi:hypothetical protein